MCLTQDATHELMAQRLSAEMHSKQCARMSAIAGLPDHVVKLYERGCNPMGPVIIFGVDTQALIDDTLQQFGARANADWGSSLIQNRLRQHLG